jgi:hypothetical protein
LSFKPLFWSGSLTIWSGVYIPSSGGNANETLVSTTDINKTIDAKTFIFERIAFKPFIVKIFVKP